MMTLAWSCKSNTTTVTEKMDHEDHADHSEDQTGIVLKAGDLTLTEVVSDPFSEATLSLVSPKQNSAVVGNKVAFDFEVGNFELGSQTGNKYADHCANSAKGQHIHLILNNSPYTAHYESKFEQEVDNGTYVGLAFLSRSYHESIKSPTAFQVFNFTVGDMAPGSDFDATKPHMFYSRPKGEYVGKDAEKVMLDFYLINTNLSKEGYKVKANINGQEVMLEKWAPYLMEGLPMGENIIELTLLDVEGNKVESPFNPVKRTVTLKAGE
jgi:hypothetical protein